MNFLQQDKLTREEWNNLEKPINNEKEKIILNIYLIILIFNLSYCIYCSK